MIDYHKALHISHMFAGMIYSSCRMGAWCFNMSKKMFYTTCPHEKEFLMFFTMSGCLDYALSPERDFTKPVFLSDSIGLIWVADYIFEKGKPNLAIVIGPVFNSASSVRGIEDSLREMNFSLEMRSSLIQKLKTVPVVTVGMMNQYAVMLHYALTEESIQPYDFEFQSAAVLPDYYLEEEDEEQLPDDRISEERKRTIEETILSMVREGNREYGRIIDMETRISVPDEYHSKNQRENRNAVVILTALCARAAIEGGLSPRTAKELEVSYITGVEKAQTVTELIAVRKEMMDDFINRVHQCRNHPEISKPVQECCDYIKGNLMKPLELKEIASAVGYTEYYLTKKFHKEMGVRLLDYIKEARIEMAKIWLLTTSKSIQEISDAMHFGTRNYFSKVFREKTGVTPAVFREQANPAGKFRES